MALAVCAKPLLLWVDGLADAALVLPHAARRVVALHPQLTLLAVGVQVGI